MKIIVMMLMSLIILLVGGRALAADGKPKERDCQEAASGVPIETKTVTNAVSVAVGNDAAGKSEGDVDFEFKKQEDDWPAAIFTTAEREGKVSKREFARTETVFLRFSIANRGSSVPDAKEELLVSLDGEPALTLTASAPLPKDMIRDYFAKVAADAIEPGRHVFSVEINPSGAIPEKNRNNNKASVSFSIAR